jgi:nicotinate-nucleotide adenylyltransferase
MTKNQPTPNHQRIGIMGGTFDPIHYGHLVTAEAARSKFNLDTVVFIPSGRPPHKKADSADTEKRYLMVLLATVANPYFQVSRSEIDRAGYSYTYDTICEFRQYYGANAELFFITGVDAILEMLTWKHADKLIEMCSFIAASRPGYDLTDIGDLPTDFRAKIELMQVPALSISSTDIRRRMREDKPIKYLLPETVETYIKKMGLYQKND